MDPPYEKRLKSMLPEWIDAWENQEKPIEPVCRYKLLKASSLMLDRVLKPYKTSTSRTQSNGTITSLKALIPIFDYRRRIEKPGYLYADTVAPTAAQQ